MTNIKWFGDGSDPDPTTAINIIIIITADAFTVFVLPIFPPPLTIYDFGPTPGISDTDWMDFPLKA